MKPETPAGQGASMAMGPEGVNGQKFALVSEPWGRRGPCLTRADLCYFGANLRAEPTGFGAETNSLPEQAVTEGAAEFLGHILRVGCDFLGETIQRQHG